jgi:predicted amidohydrolase YtcJ
VRRVRQASPSVHAVRDALSYVMTPPSTPPDRPALLGALAIVNARVWTGDARRPWVDAVLIRGERLEIVGSSAEVKKQMGEGARTLDARGMLMIPGFRGGNSAPLARMHAAVARRDGADANEIGVLAPGSVADLTLIDRDITRMAPVDAESARVMLTLVRGHVAYDPDGMLR